MVTSKKPNATQVLCPGETRQASGSAQRHCVPPTTHSTRPGHPLWALQSKKKPLHLKLPGTMISPFRPLLNSLRLITPSLFKSNCWNKASVMVPLRDAAIGAVASGGANAGGWSPTHAEATCNCGLYE